MEEQEKHINLHATPEMMAGVYANFANVSHSDYEFSITFVRLDHESEEPGEMNRRRGAPSRRLRRRPAAGCRRGRGGAGFSSVLPCKTAVSPLLPRATPNG